MWIGEKLRIVLMALRLLKIFPQCSKNTSKKKKKSQVQKCKGIKFHEHFALYSKIVFSKYTGKIIFVSTALVPNKCVQSGVV